MSEDKIQEEVVKYILYVWPKTLLSATLGGIRTSYKQAVKAKRTGYKKGQPDLFVYEPRGAYNGLALEIKTNKGYATKEQKQWIVDLNLKGYKASVQKGWENIINEIDKYMSLPQLIISNEKDKQKATKDK